MADPERNAPIRPSTADLRERVHALEVGLAEVRGDARAAAAALERVDGKLDFLVEEVEKQREERLERERRREQLAHEREMAQLAARRERWKSAIGIVVPTITALGTLLAGILGAFR